MKFILWNAGSESPPRCDDDGTIVSDGIIGRVDADNAYLTIYGTYRDERRPKDLEVGCRIAGVTFTLSGGYGCYDIYRVR